MFGRISLSLALLTSAVHAEIPEGPRRLPDAAATMKMLEEHGTAILFVGHGSKGQYADMIAVKIALDEQVERLDRLHGKGKWFAMFGGDNFNAEKPDIAHVIKHLVDAHGVPTLAVQSDVVIDWGGVDKHLSYVLYVPTVKKPVLDDRGRPVIEDGKPKLATHWGGLINGVPAGPTAFYLGHELLDHKPSILKEVIAVGGGPIGLEEVMEAYWAGVPVTYIRAETRHPEVNGQYGSIDHWASELVDHWHNLECEPLFLARAPR